MISLTGKTIEEVEKEGNIEKEESELIQSAIEFSDVDIADIYTPRVEVCAVDIEDTKEEIAITFKNNPYSRIPVYEHTIDNIIGFIHHRDFYELEENEYQNILEELEGLELLSDDETLPLETDEYLIYKLEKDCHVTTSIPANEFTKQFYKDELKRIEEALD